VTEIYVGLEMNEKERG